MMPQTRRCRLPRAFILHTRVLSPEAKNEGSGIFWHAVSGGLLRSQLYVRALFGRRDLRRLLRLKLGEIGQDEMHDLSFLLRYHFGRLALSYFTVTVVC